jgi:hypothetical protein
MIIIERIIKHTPALLSNYTRSFLNIKQFEYSETKVLI